MMQAVMQGKAESLLCQPQQHRMPVQSGDEIDLLVVAIYLAAIGTASRSVKSQGEAIFVSSSR